MALAYTAPTWEDGSGTGISASQLQALSDCMQGLVQGSDKAIHSITFNNGIATITYADGSIESNVPANMKGISSIAKTGTVDLVDTYTVTYTDGTTFTYTVTNGRVGQDGRDGAIQYTPGSGITISDQNVISADAQPQEQADWDEADSTAVDYIKNKPNLSLFYAKDDDTISSIESTDYLPVHSYQAGDTGARQISYSNLKSDITKNCYEIYDSTANTIADTDYVPLLDMSMPGDGSPVKALFSTFKSTLKSYFDGIYAAITALGTYESGATASKAYAVGEHFYKNGKFCTAKSAIASGATFTLGTNYVEGTVADAIQDDLLLSRFDLNVNYGTNYDTGIAVSDCKKYNYLRIVTHHNASTMINFIIVPIIKSLNYIGSTYNVIYYNGTNYMMLVCGHTSTNIQVQLATNFSGTQYKITGIEVYGVK